MLTSPRRFIVGLIITVFISCALYIFLRTFPGHSTMWVLPRFHFYVVSATLVLAAVSSTVIGWTGVRLRDVNVLMLALALLSLTGFFLIHGLSTPGFIIPNAYHLTGVASQVAMTTCAMWLGLSTLPADNSFIRYISKQRSKTVIGWLVLIVASNIVGLAFPKVSDDVPIDILPLNYIIAIITIGLYALAAKQNFRQYRIARFPMHRAIVFGAVMLSITECMMVTTVMWTLAWWLYHVALVVSTVALLVGVLAQYKSNVSIIQTFHQMFSADPFERIRIGISSSMQNLIMATEAKDAYTAGHNFRVAHYAVQLGQEMNLSPELLKALARGGLIHDVGKISVPPSILNKPGKLSTEERAIIEQHPSTGYEICKYIGFMTDELAVIRHHHEKWDGSGYPDKLRGDEISLLARILAVADVYDALTSRRSYREPWSHDRALQMIEEGSGTHFDPDCVNAWIRLCKSNDFMIPEPARQLGDQKLAQTDLTTTNAIGE